MNLVTWLTAQKIMRRMNFQVLQSDTNRFSIVSGHGKVKKLLDYWDLRNYNLRETQYFEELRRRKVQFVGMSLSTIIFKDKDNAQRAMFIYLELAANRIRRVE